MTKDKCILVPSVISIVLGLGTGCHKSGSEPGLCDIYDLSVDMSWSSSSSVVTDGVSEFGHSIAYERRAVYGLLGQTGYTLKIIFTSDAASRLQRLRLVYHDADGKEHVLDEASEQNARIGLTDVSAVVKGTIPIDARNRQILVTDDSGVETCIEKVGP